VPDGSNLSFKSKVIGSSRYWYLFISIGSRRSEHYLGEETPELLSQIDQQKQLWRSREADRSLRAKIVAMLSAGGAVTVGSAEGRVLALMEASGVFSAGAVLIGTFAYLAYANMLGVQWSSAYRTQDLDLAHEISMPLAYKGAGHQVELREALLNAGLGFVEVPALNRKSPSTRFKLLGKELIVELLVPMVGPNSSKPVKVPALGAFGEPVRYLDYLLEDTQVAVMLYKYGIGVSVPSPARFAIHKLVVSQRRPPAFASKSQKDILQAAQLIEVLLEDRPGDLYIALEAASKMGARFLEQLQKGAKMLPSEVYDEIKSLLP
jgi:hypothetical protein